MKLRAGLWLIAVIAGAACLFYPAFLILDICEIATGKTVWYTRMQGGEEFVLSFVHSVNKRPVFDTLRVENDHLVIVKSVFDTFGAGMPEASTEEGELRILPDGWLQWTVNRPVPEIVVRIGRIAEHTLNIKKESIRLTDISEPGAALVFRVRRISLWAIMKDRIMR